MLRPSLSEVRVARDQLRQATVAGVYAPAFVERTGKDMIWLRDKALSPESMLRPSLSEVPAVALSGVAVLSPESMLRPSLSGVAGPLKFGFFGLSPESMLRPSLSVRLFALRYPARILSPESMLRPSLSGASGWWCRTPCSAVAGVYAPAFVERSTRRWSCRRGWALSPESMLRPSLSAAGPGGAARRMNLSPESMLRPSLSGLGPPRGRRRRRHCRRSLCSGLR